MTIEKMFPYLRDAERIGRKGYGHAKTGVEELMAAIEAHPKTATGIAGGAGLGIGHLHGRHVQKDEDYEDMLARLKEQGGYR